MGKAWYEKWGDAIVDGYKNAGEMFEWGAEQWGKGNYLGAASSFLTGTFAGVGNTITLGGANAIGENIADKVDDVEAGKLDENGDKVELNFAENIVAKIAKGNAESMILQDELADAGELGYANLLGGIDVASYALDFAGGMGLTQAGKQLVTGVAKTGVKQAVKTTVKETTEEIVEQGAKQAAKTAVKEVAEEGAEQVAKTAAKTAVKEIAEEGAEQAGKKIVRETVKETVETTAKVGLKDRLTHMGLSGAGAYVAANVDGSDAYRIIENTKDDGFGSAMVTEAKRAVADTVDNVGTLADDVVDDAGGAVMGAVADKWPALAKFINTARAAFYATSSELTQTTPGSYAIAVFEAAKERVSAWFSESDYKYEGKSLGDIAHQLRENSQGFADTWQGAYKKRVLHLDEELGLDSSDRKFMMGDDEPVLA